jgi:hypothetical protein
MVNAGVTHLEAKDKVCNICLSPKADGQCEMRSNLYFTLCSGNA